MENEFQEPSFGEIVELIQQYEQAAETEEHVFFAEENFEQIVHFYEENGELNKVLRVLDSALAQYSFSSFFHTKKAEILANQKHFEEALSILETAELLDPTDLNVLLIRADIYLWEGKHAEAMAQVNAGLTMTTLAEDKCELYLQMADIFEDQERFEEMTDALKSALIEDPKSEEGLNRFWFCTELLEQYEESVAFHKILIEKSPYSHLAWFNLGHAYVGLGEFEKSLEAFSFVIAIDENFDAAYICTADVLYNVERYDESLKFYLDAIRLSKPNKELYVKAGECHEKIGDLIRARSYFRKAISIDPYYDEAFYKLGETFRREENWTKAISSYERAVKLSKENVDYLIALGEAYMVAEDAEKATEMFERVVQIEPDIKQNSINLAGAYFGAGDFRKAFEILNEAALKFEGHSDIFYIKAVFYFQVGNKNEGLLNLEKGLLINFEQHSVIFEMDESLLENDCVMQVIEHYRA
jgi:tetratricopeptide (TPR) repeat protein